MVLAHISDLHVSRFGEHVSSLRSRGLHGRRPGARTDWQTVETVDGWHVETSRGKARLVDERGIVHDTRGIDARAQLLELARERMRTHYARLAENLPSAAATERLLAEDPHNTNLLFCRVAHRLRADPPDWVVLTGDVTDDSVGYELVLAGLAPFVERGRVLAVPGNHDIYDSPLLVVPAHERKKREEKRRAWSTFAAALGLPERMPWTRDLGAGVVMCGIDSCFPPKLPFSASGAVPPQALAALREQLRAVPVDACRLAMLHHHVVNLPTRAIGLAPIQVAIRLRNAREVFDFLCDERFAAVFNGHRHVGYRYQPAHAPLFVSAPSSTLGCRSRVSVRPYYWRVEIDSARVVSVAEQAI